MQKSVNLLHGVVDLETTAKGQLVLTVAEFIREREKVCKIRFDKADSFLKLSESMEVACNGKVQILDDTMQNWNNVEMIIVKSKLHTENHYLVYSIDFTWGDEQGKRFMFIESEYNEMRAIALDMSKIKRINL